MNADEIKMISKKRLLYVGFVCGITLAAALTFLNAEQYTLLLRVLTAVIVGLIGGLLLKGAIKKPYTVAITASLYAYAANLLLVSAQLFHSALYITLLTTLSIAFFFVSNKFFNAVKISDTKKIAVTIAILIIFYTVSAFIGLLTSRLIAPTYIY